MIKQAQILRYYGAPARMSSAGSHKALFTELPEDVAALARIIQGLDIYEHTAEDFYGFAVPEERKRESQLRSTEQSWCRSKRSIRSRCRLLARSTSA